MKKLIFIYAVSSLLSVAAMAQTPTPPPRSTTTAPTPSGAAPPGGTGAEGKFAVINIGRFSQGINELKVKIDALNAEFDPKRKEVQTLEEEINALKNKLQTQSNTVTPQVRSQLADDITEKEKVYKRKTEDYDQLARKRLSEVSQPIYEKIRKFLDDYCAQRKIVMVVEAGASYETGILVYSSPAADITEDFMKEYNAAGAKKP